MKQKHNGKGHITEKEINLILKELNKWSEGERGKKLSWQYLENLSGYSRQSLYTKPQIKELYFKIKKTIRSESPKEGSNKYRQTLEQRIKFLQHQVTELEEQKNSWLELWARYHYNANTSGIDIQVLEKPLPSLIR